MKYRATFIIDASAFDNVEADTIDEAVDLAYDSDKSSPRLCHHCASDVEIGDCIGLVLYDENDNEIFNDSQFNDYVKENDGLKKQLNKNNGYFDVICEALSIKPDSSLTEILEAITK